MRVLKIIGDIGINTNLPEDADITEVKLDDYMVTEYEEKFDVILCIHTLQTLWTDQLSGAIEKLLNDLVNYGELHIHVPATEQAVRAMLKGIQDPVIFYMVWGSRERPFHSGFNLLWLRALVENAGGIVRTATMGKFKMQRGDE